ncbi:MAG: ABC transporter ATP-binding protein [Thermaerobacter sp.]|nr:ABC transporter ATP-binding protein [Thermaerobacter sp.]
MNANAIIETDNVTVRFPRPSGQDIVAVRAVNLFVASRETVALVGESGSGKTTLGHTLVRLLRPSAGKVWFHGRDVSLIHGTALARYHGDAQLIFQDPFASLNPFHTVSYHLQRPLRRLRRLGRSEAQEMARELLTRVGLTPATTYQDRYPHELSGGQRQRVAIARALAADPTFIVADEPVSMLDVSLRAGILRLLMSLQAQQGLSYLYVTHDLASARYLAQRIAVMYGGSIVEVANAEDLIRRSAHPYTQLLLAASTGTLGTDLPETQQVAPDLSQGRRGCPFAPRCPVVMPICHEEMPEPVAVGPNHVAACFRVHSE